MGELTCCADAVLYRELALVCLVLQALVVAQIFHLPPDQTSVHYIEWLRAIHFTDDLSLHRSSVLVSTGDTESHSAWAVGSLIDSPMTVPQSHTMR